jgi:hypothetical protein
MLTCQQCKREVVGVREQERNEAVIELIEDTFYGRVLGNTVKRRRTKPVHLEQIECGWGEFSLAEVGARVATGWAVQSPNQKCL